MLFLLTCSLKEQDFLHLREEIGTAKSLEDFERVAAKLKSMLLVCCVCSLFKMIGACLNLRRPIAEMKEQFSLYS